jgi:hypothetical protein
LSETYLPHGFVEGPHFADDLARIDLSNPAGDLLMFALQDLLLAREAAKVSRPLSSKSDVRYLRTREFPSLDMPPLYLTFRFESADLIELRRIVTEDDVRGGLVLGL